ncbi:MAG: Hsp70 family protein [Rhodococcus sp. (in: high G+C Gram-positive bacteria)]|uniref:Hsp70 family protein n=1 Tax=Rhodococcus sp. EPR-157 TaxID=1813677 RepID=UPI0007BC2853|nr:Hsp70 family protein [Rhodococcus sp. EPR-157]KZF08742.1 hypothetical protein A2J03_03890 [Rhodococcus sp. EPR-157]
MTVLLGVSMGAHAVRMALPRNGTAVASLMSSARVLEAPQQLFFRNQVIDTVDDDVEYLAAESISAVAAETERQMATGVAYRDAHQADTLHRALEHQHLQNYRLVNEVEAVVEYLIASGEAAGYSTVALYDLGSSGLNVSVVDLAARRVIVTRRSTEFSGDQFDAILRDNQLDRLGKPSDAPDIDLFTRRCRVAKERLSGNDAVCLPDESGMILLSRDSYETLIADEVDRSIEFARDVLIGAHVPIDAVVLVGGGSRIPLVRKRVGVSLDLPALTPNEPESVAARGAALSARPAEGGVADRARPAVAATVGNGTSDRSALVSPRPTDATPTISISRDSLPTALPPLVSASAAAVGSSERTASLPPVPPSLSTPEPESPEQPASASHFALQNVYWLDADYQDDDGETIAEYTRRRVRAWSIVGVAAAAIVAVSGFLLLRPSSAPPVVDTAVTDAPAPSVAATTPPAVPSAPVAPVAPPPPETTAAVVPVEPEPTVDSPTTAEQTTQEAPAPTQQAPAPAPEPPPLIPGLPDFTLPTIPPLFPPAP